MQKAHTNVLRNGQSSAFILEAGYRVRITDLVGSQIGSFCAYAEPADGKEFSWTRSIDAAKAKRDTNPPGYAGLLEGDYLLSAQGDRIMRITADTMEIKGITNVHATLCNRRGKVARGLPDHDYCYESVYTAAEPWGLEIPTTQFGRNNTEDYLDRLDLFAKPQDDTSASLAVRDDLGRRVVFGTDGKIVDGDAEDYKAEFEKADEWQTLGGSLSRPGDYQEFESVTQCLVSFANCVHGEDESMKFEIFG
jgi:uncharacterized protein YcgI (DUF1989 family)